MDIHTYILTAGLRHVEVHRHQHSEVGPAVVGRDAGARPRHRARDSNGHPSALRLANPRSQSLGVRIGAFRPGGGQDPRAASHDRNLGMVAQRLFHAGVISGAMEGTNVEDVAVGTEIRQQIRSRNKVGRS